MFNRLILVVQMLWCLVWFVALVGVATNLADPTVNINGEVYPTEVCTTYEYTKTVKIEAEEFSCDYGTCKACVCNQEVFWDVFWDDFHALLYFFLLFKLSTFLFFSLFLIYYFHYMYICYISAWYGFGPRSLF